MKVTVEWLDGEVRIYDDIDKSEAGTDQVLRLYGRRKIGGPAELITAIPHAGVREWKLADR
ncbi:hypothetical protein OHA21_43895 [Actinoplanes sp. NBC_00393]|uniref:hypothetical protein n=1 Tax=Actinoplanes sp. NBC_00393 TaxID=2975953 RepID=UPI002E24AF58